MKIGDWVKTYHNSNKITGFVTDLTDDIVTVFVTIPKNYGEIQVKKKDIWLADNVIGPDEVLMLIDLSLEK